VSLDVGIVCDPRRAETAHQLQRELNEQGVKPRMTWDERRDEWETHARAWSVPVPARRTHRLILQEDAVPCRDLVPGVERALTSLPPNTIVSLYFGFHSAYRGPSERHRRAKAAARRARQLEPAWIEAPGTWWGVAIVLPVAFIAPALEFCEGRPEVYDTRLGRWIDHAGVGPVRYTWPSLVDHADEPSLAWPTQVAGRRAHEFIGRDRSALADWNPIGSVITC
jgi:hypothetical protein